jgi:hypothetical protein
MKIPVQSWDELVYSTTRHNHFQRLDLRRRAFLLRIDLTGHALDALNGARNYFKHYPPRFISLQLSMININLELLTLV